MKIIGISGRMKSGKSTVAEYLEKNLEGYYVWVEGFSDAIKYEANRLFQMCEDWESLDRQDVKSKRHESGKTNRQILQEFGVKMREIIPDFWVARLLKSFCEGHVFIVPDVRFPNEVKAIQEMGGIVIRLTRNPVDSNDETETSLDGIVGQIGKDCRMTVVLSKPKTSLLFDYTVNNEVLSIDETNKICLEIAKEYLNEGN